MTSRAVRPWLLLFLLLVTTCAGARTPSNAPSATLQGSGGVNRLEHREKPYVVLVSLDAMRTDYLDTRDLPNIRRVIQRGARAKALLPVFPSLTFPNHYSLVTGLYAENHGIVSNSFYDPARRATYALGDRASVTDGTWYRGEPIWVTAETQGMVSHCFFWPGSEAAIKGVRPTVWRQYDAKVPTMERVKTVVEWLRLPDERRPHVITLYFSDVDSATHSGPLDSPRANEALRTVDAAVGMLVDGVDALPIRDRVYLLLTSDHGMVETTEKHRIRLDSLIDMEGVQQAFGGPVSSLHMKSDAEPRRVRDAINSRLTHGRAYLRQEVPARHHYRNDPRIGDVVIIMDEAWSIVTTPRVIDRVVGLVQPDRRGAHGWDPAYPSMHAMFVAMGPRIRPGTTLPAVNNVDVYALMTEVLGLQPAAGVDGKSGLREALMR